MKSKMVIFFVLIISMNIAAVPATINFQGAIKDANGVPVNDTQFMEFRIYDVGSNLVWSEQHLTVEIVDGIFSEELGLFSQFPPGMIDIPELYITFFYGGEEMTPWQKLNSVPYAFKADNSNLIEDVPLSGLVQQDMSGNATITGTMTADSFVGDGSGLTNLGSFDDLYVNTTGPDTISAAPPSWDIGVLNINHQGSDGSGLIITSDGSLDAGITMNDLPGNGIEMLNTSGNGIYISNASSYAYRAIGGGSHFRSHSSGSFGLEVYSSGGHGINMSSIGGDGINIGSADGDGVYANTTQGTGEWGIYTPDKIYGSNISTRSQSTHVRYVGNEMLESGDLVCIAGGFEENVLGEDDDLPVVNVTEANSINSEAVLGVVEYKVNIQAKSEELDDRKTEVKNSFRFAEGSISNGDYLSVIVFGPADVNVGRRSNIKTGEKLTVADNGYTRSITDEDNWRIGILGKALEDSNGRGKIKVFVNCR